MPGDPSRFQGVTLPAPSGGLNLIDAIDNMPPTDALELVNMYPKGTTVQVRGGYAQHCVTAITGSIRALYKLALADGSLRLISTGGAELHESADGSDDDITSATIPTNNDFNGFTFNHRLFLLNGADTPQVYTGSGIAANTAFTGVTQADLISGGSFKERVWFIKKNSLSAYYGEVKAVAGALSHFDLSYFMKDGGRLVYAGSYTAQLGDGSSDLMMFVSSEGEILFYAGDYPGGNAWALVARQVVGRPMGYRSLVRVDNDLWIITEQGILPVSLLFSGGPTVALNSIGRKINPLISEYAANIGFNHLWHGMHWAAGRRVYIVVPTSSTNTFLLVCNIDTGAWTKFTFDTTGACLAIAVVSGLPYYGNATGVVHKAEQVGSDNGSPINFNARHAFSFFGSRHMYKKFQDVRPLMRGPQGIELGLSMDTDFRRQSTTTAVTTATGTFTLWGSVWGSPWSGGIDYITDRFSIEGQGHSGALRVEGSIQDTNLEFHAFDVRFEAGGQI